MRLRTAAVTAGTHTASERAEAENGTQRHAYAFEPRVNTSAYAISYGPGAGCSYREIRKDDYAENWTA